MMKTTINSKIKVDTFIWKIQPMQNKTACVGDYIFVISPTTITKTTTFKVDFQ